MSTARRLWLGFGTLTALLVIVCIGALSRLRAVQSEVAPLAHAAHDGSAAARELESDVVSYALAVRVGERPPVDEAAAAVERRLDACASFAATDDDRRLVAELRERWHDLAARGTRLLDAAGTPGAAGHAAAFLDGRVALVALVNSRLQTGADLAYVQQHAALRAELTRAVVALLIALASGTTIAVVTSLSVARGIVRTERRLRTSEARNRIATDAAGLGVFEWTAATDAILWENDRIYEIFGRTRAEGPLNKAAFYGGTLHPDDLPAFDRALADAAGRAAPLHQRMRVRRTDNAELRWIEITGIVAAAPDGTPAGLTGVVADVTDRVAAQEALGRREALLRLAIESALAFAFEWDIVNDRVQRLSAEAALPETGRDYDTFEDVARRMHPEDAALFRANVAAALQDPRGQYRSEHRITRPDGTVRCLAERGRVEFDAAGRPLRLLGIGWDITDRRQAEEELRRHRERLEELVAERTAELERSHERLRASERIGALGTLAAGLGHDMGNLLVPLRIRVDELARLAPAPDAQSHIDAIRELLGYLRDLATGLRALALDPEDAGAAAPTTTLDAWWREVRGVCEASLPRAVTLGAGPLDALPPVRIPRHALTQAVFNLVQNAGDALRERGRGTIRLDAIREGDTVRLAVRDDGPGMTDDVRRRCLEPFFTTKARGRGTGLGLAIVHSLLARYGGAVDVDSAPGAGTVFTLAIPVGEEEPSTPCDAAVTVHDVRTAAVACALLGGFGVRTRSHAPGARPIADLWIADATVEPRELRAFTETPGSPRTAVRIGPPLELGPRVIAAEPGPAALRAALHRAVRAARSGP